MMITTTVRKHTKCHCMGDGHERLTRGIQIDQPIPSWRTRDLLKSTRPRTTTAAGLETLQGQEMPRRCHSPKGA